MPENNDIITQKLDADGNAIEYKGFPFLSNIDMYVQTELHNRGLDRVRTIVPYIKATPGFTPDGNVPSKVVMKGIEAPNDKDPSTYDFKDLYRPDAFYRPLAGLKNVTIDYKNAYGSIRKATITWICHTLEDLERLSPYFLNPGYSIFIEWGWSNYALDVINNDPPVDFSNYFEYGRIRQKQTQGNYDCMLGIVTNYSFKMNNDGGFDCTTEIISSGYLMEGMTIPNQFTQDVTELRRKELHQKHPNKTDEEIKEILDDENEKSVGEQAKILRTLSNFLKEKFYAQIKNHLSIFNNENTVTDYFLLISKFKEIDKEFVDDDKGLKTPTEVRDPLNPTDTEKTTTIEVSRKAAVYASWGYLEDFVLNPHIAITSDNKKILFGFDSSDSKIGYHEHLRTTDLGICILPEGNSGAPDTPDVKRGETDDSGYNFAYARRILINVDFFRDTMLNSTTVLDGVLQVWSAINDACINFWTFKLKMNEQYFDDSQTDANRRPLMVRGKPIMREQQRPQQLRAINKYSIIDINYADRIFNEMNVSTDDIYVFRTKGFKIHQKETGLTTDATSVIKNLNFNSKLSSQAALNVFYSAQNSDGRILGAPQTNTFRSLYDFGIGDVDYSKAKDTFSVPGLRILASEDSIDFEDDTKAPDPGTSTEREIREQAAYGDDLTKFLPWGGKTGKDGKDVGSKGYYVTLPDGTRLSGIEGMKMAVLLKDGKNNPVTSTALVPLDCELEIQGISGIRIGNIFTMDHIPKIYQNHGLFQVVGITETISKDSWVTKLRSQFRVFNNVNYTKLRGTVNSDKVQVPFGKYVNITDADKSTVTLAQKDLIRERVRAIWTDPAIEGFIASKAILDDAEKIIIGESSWRQYNFNVDVPDDSYGLFQINMIKSGRAYYPGGKLRYTSSDLYSKRTKWTDLDIIKDLSSVHPSIVPPTTFTHHNLWDMDTNIKVAKRIFKIADGVITGGYSWHPWGAKRHLPVNRQSTSLKKEIIST